MAQGSQPIIMTGDQYNHLAGLFANNHTEALVQAKLQRAINTVDRCDGVAPQPTREWIRSMDGWETEGCDADFIFGLVKATTTGDLLTEVRGWLHQDQPLTTWTDLREKITENFLSACETIRLQTELESTRQKPGESASAYIRRYKLLAARAYPNDRADTDEHRVVSAFLKGFTDREFGCRLFRTGRTQTLATASVVALEKETQREKEVQILGHEPMEVGSGRPENVMADKLLSVIETMQRRMEQIQTGVSKNAAKLESVDRPGPPAPRQNYQESPRDKREYYEEPPVNRREYYDEPRYQEPPVTKRYQRRRDTRGEVKPRSRAPRQHREEPPAPKKRNHSPQWTREGEPICLRCDKVGHMSRNCDKRSNTSAVSGGGD